MAERNIFADYYRSGVDQRVDSRVLEATQIAFDGAGVDMSGRIRSGYRSPSRNRKAGGAKKSQHMLGKAIDIDVRDLPIETRKELIQALSAAGITGIGVYANTIHADIGPRRSWGPSYSIKSLPGWAADAIKDHLKNAWSGKLPAIAAAAPALPKARPTDYDPWGLTSREVQAIDDFAGINDQNIPPDLPRERPQGPEEQRVADMQQFTDMQRAF